jgi:predicted MFS family arabinose efflux permease
VAAAKRYVTRTWLALGVLCLAAIVNLLQSSSLSPLLPSIGREFGTPDSVTGQLATLGSIVGFGFSLAATPWMDRWSRRTWFRLEGGLILAGLLICAFAPSFAVMALGRVLTASGASLIMANCMTGAREIFPDPVKRNRAIGFITSMTTLVFIIGLPVVTQIEARFGWRVALLAITVPVLILLPGTHALPESRLTAPPRRHGGPFSAFRVVLGERRVAAFLVVIGLISALYTGWFVYFGAYTIEVFAVSASVLSLLFLLSGATQLISNNVAPLLLRRFQALRVVNVVLMAVAIGLLLTGIVFVSIPTALLAAILVINGCAIAYISTNVILLDSGLPHPGAVMSMAAATGSLGAALGPLITGVALANTGSFEASYRILGILAPLAILVIWLGTRGAPVAAGEQMPAALSSER